MKRHFVLTVFVLMAIVFGLTTTTVLAEEPAEIDPFHDCDIDVALVKDHEKPTHIMFEKRPPTAHRPLWKVVMVDYSKRTSLLAADCWGHSLERGLFVDDVMVDSWAYAKDWIRRKNYEVSLYNEAGLFAFGKGDTFYTDPYRCRVATPKENTWESWIAPRHHYAFGADYVNRQWFKEDIPIGFETTFSLGKRLTRPEVEWVYQNPTTRHWEGLGFIGGSNSAERFVIDADGRLSWVWTSWKRGTYRWHTNGEHLLNFQLPLEREIVIDTIYFYEDGSERETTQRIVLIRNQGPLEQYRGRIDMLEVLD